MWLTGSDEVLAPIEGHVVTTSHKGAYRLTVALVYHPRSRVIKEIAGLKVEVLEGAWSSIEGAAPIPLSYREQPSAYILVGLLEKERATIEALWLYQPADRFLTFQLMEAAIFLRLSAICLFVAADCLRFSLSKSR